MLPRNYLTMFKMRLVNTLLNVCEKDRKCVSQDNWANNFGSVVQVFGSHFDDIMAIPFLGNV
jgi:hypothetical protein